MGMSSSKTKTKSTSSSTPLSEYAPYINQGLTSAQGVLDSNQGNLGQMSQSAYGLYNNLAGQVGNDSYVNATQKQAQNLAGGQYLGTNPGASTYTSLQNAAANDPSMGTLSHLAQGSTSPGQYDGIGASNPSLGILQGMTNQQVNGDTSQFYKDTLSGKYLNNNPYIDQMAQQAMDSALKSVNQRYAASGMGAGMSTPYAAAAGDTVANANNTLRYTNYNNELQRMGTIGAQSDGEYDRTQDRSLSAANSLGSQYNASGQIQLGAQQAKDAAFNNDRSAQLAAGQSLGSQYNANNATALAGATGADNQQNQQIQQMLAAMGLAPGLANAQYAGVSPALQALTSAAQIPYTGVNNYAGLVNSLTGKYGNTDSSSTTTQSSNIGQMMTGLAGSALGAFATGGLGSLGGALGGAAGSAGSALGAAGINPMGWPMAVNHTIGGLG
jgi:hypothetical protein